MYMPPLCAPQTHPRPWNYLAIKELLHLLTSLCLSMPVASYPTFRWDLKQVKLCIKCLSIPKQPQYWHCQHGGSTYMYHFPERGPFCPSPTPAPPDRQLSNARYHTNPHVNSLHQPESCQHYNNNGYCSKLICMPVQDVVGPALSNLAPPHTITWNWGAMHPSKATCSWVWAKQSPWPRFCLAGSIRPQTWV